MLQRQEMFKDIHFGVLGRQFGQVGADVVALVVEFVTADAGGGFEELLADDETTEPTQHPKLRVAKTSGQQADRANGRSFSRRRALDRRQRRAVCFRLSERTAA